MKNFLVYLSLGLTLFLTGCSSEDNTFSTPEEEVAQSKTITIAVGMPETSSKSRVNFDDASRTFTWDDGDCLTVLGYGKDGYIGSSDFNLTSGGGQKSATFIGKTVAGATEYVVYYKTPNLSFKDQSNGENLAVMSYEGQTQNTRRTTAHLKGYLFLQSERMAAENFEKGKFKLKVENSIMRFNIQSAPADMGRIESLEWENNMGTPDAHATALALVSTDMDGQIDPFEDQGSTTVPFPLNARQSDEIVVYLCFDPEAMELKAKQTLNVTFQGSRKKYRVNVLTGGMTYQKGYRYRATISMTPGNGVLSNWQEVQ